MSHNKAIVFAYHTVGVKCLTALLDGGFEVPLVVTHEDHPEEVIWFESVSKLCQARHIPYITPTDLNTPELVQQIQNIAPDYLFSFYYRFMIPDQILSLAKIAALNMHGSLLPKYRGRVPVNWAVLHGEIKTGATLHVMETKPDAGDIVSQKQVPIGPDDTAFMVFNQVAQAAVIVLDEVLPELRNGNFSRRPNRLQEGSYFGARKPEDGRIDWQQPAAQVYNLYRAVAPPYPGAFTQIGQRRLVIAKAQLASLPNTQTKLVSGLQIINQRIYGVCGDGRCLLVTSLQLAGQEIRAKDLKILLSQT
ncbi:MAG: formyltransferase [Polynucleobacter sp.]|jgi:methionyl-tRNA formyltransferase|nr:formyltransferase [Polynucleobacter sp.]